jgi:hypothetical protein
MVSKRVFIFILVGTVVALLLAGCGSGGGNDSAPTKEAFLREANTVCAEGTAEREEVMLKAFKAEERSSDEPTQAEREQFILSLLPSYEKTTRELSELQPPAGDEKKLEAMVAAMEETAEKVAQSPQTALSSDVQYRKANEMLHAYGLGKC